MATILVVDDRPTNRELLLTLLGYAGHRVLEATEGEEGLAIARTERPDLIITDIVMPTMDGYEFARQVRADPAISETQIIFYTSSYIVSETHRLAEACGVSIVMSKPIEPEELLRTVQAVLDVKQKPVMHPASEDFHREHMRLLTDTLANKVEELEAEVIERKRVEEALQDSEELFRSAFQYSPVGMCITSLDGKLQTVNQSLVNMLGFSVEEVVGKHFNDITYSEDLEIGQDAVNRLVSGEVQSVAFEKRYLHKARETVWAHISSTLLRDSSGKPIHFVTQILDITERKRAEEQVRAYSARLKVLADASQTFATSVHDYEKMLEIVARQTAEAMNGFCGVRLLSDDREWMEMVTMHDVDPEALELARRLVSQPMRADEPNFVQRILQSERAFLMPGVSEDQLRAVVKPEDWVHLKYIASHSRLLVPIRTRNESLGFLIIARKVGSSDFDEHDLRLAEDLADRAALAIANARLFKQVQNELVERQRTEAARLESEARYHRVLDAMMEGCQIIDFDWRYVYLNDVVVAQGKYKREELLNHTMMEMYLGIENTELFAVLRQCMEDRTPRRMENQFVFPDGSIGWFELSIQPAREGIFILSTDITERKRAEEQINYQARLLRHINDAVIATDDQLHITAWNRAAEKLYGWTSKEAIGQTVSEVLSVELTNEQQRESRDYLTESNTARGERIYLRKDGRAIYVEVNTIALTDKDGRMTGYVSVHRDITERKRAEEALQAKNEELKVMSQQLWQAAKLATMGELAASIAHELNNPLATVSLRAEMLQGQFTPDDANSRSLQVIDSEVKRMSSLVANLLQFSRRSTSQISTIRLNEEVANTLELVQYHLRKNSILTVQEFSPEMPLIQADRQQLRQVFLNLFTNAADAMPLGGMLTIRTWSGEKPDAGITAPLQLSTVLSLGLPVSEVPQVFIEVSDTGEGITADKLEKVWEPFYTTKPEGKGTGLGLAICRRIIQEHRGTIDVISEGIPGKGTTVRISLPAVKGG